MSFSSKVVSSDFLKVVFVCVLKWVSLIMGSPR